MPAADIRSVALYARVSTDEQKEGQTIDSQVAEIERFARDRAWPIAGIYKDEGWSGALMARPELDRLRDHARQGRFQAVLINDVDRLARDVAHLGIIKRDLERHGANVIFRKLPADSSPTSNLMVNILGSFAEFERELIADRTRRGRRFSIEVRKRYLGSNTAYGYRYIKKEQTADKCGELRLEPSEAEVVREIFAWVDQDGFSARRVVARLNERGTPSPKGRGPWGRSTILRLLRNTMYCGTWYYNKSHVQIQGDDARPSARPAKRTVRRPKDDWLPLDLPEPLRLVSRARWERVQRRLRDNIAFSPRNEKHRYLLKGLVRCGGCGGAIVGDPCHGKFYYRCTNRCKRQPSVAEAKLNRLVMAAVSRVPSNPDLILEPLQRLNDLQLRNDARRSTVSNAAEKTLADLAREEQRVFEAYRAGVITPAQLALQLESIADRRTAAEAAKTTSAPPYLTGEQALAVRETCATVSAKLNELSPGGWQELLRSLVTWITLHEEVLIEGKVQALPGGTAEDGVVFRVEASERTPAGRSTGEPVRGKREPISAGS